MQPAPDDPLTQHHLVSPSVTTPPPIYKSRGEQLAAPSPKNLSADEYKVLPLRDAFGPCLERTRELTVQPPTHHTLQHSEPPL
jgi:hypothetical protein